MDSSISANTVYGMSRPSGNFACTSKVLSPAGSHSNASSPSSSNAYISVVFPS